MHKILMDLFMPNMDGLQATREIRKWEKERGQKHIPIISLTANVMPGIFYALFLYYLFVFDTLRYCARLFRGWNE